MFSTETVLEKVLETTLVDSYMVTIQYYREAFVKGSGENKWEISDGVQDKDSLKPLLEQLNSSESLSLEKLAMREALEVTRGVVNDSVVYGIIRYSF